MVGYYILKLIFLKGLFVDSFLNTVDFLLYLGIKSFEQLPKACLGGSGLLVASLIVQSLKSLDTTSLIYLLKHIFLTLHAFSITSNFIKNTSCKWFFS